MPVIKTDNKKIAENFYLQSIEYQSENAKNLTREALKIVQRKLEELFDYLMLQISNASLEERYVDKDTHLKDLDLCLRMQKIVERTLHP